MPIYVVFYFIFLLFRAVPTAYGSFQARGRIGAVAAHLPTPHPQKLGIQAVSVTYATAHSNARSRIHGVRPGSEPTSSWILVRFVSLGPQWELWEVLFFAF